MSIDRDNPRGFWILDFGHYLQGRGSRLRLRNAKGKAVANSASFGFWIGYHVGWAGLDIV